MSTKKRPADVLIPGASSSALGASGPDYICGPVSIFGLGQLELHFLTLRQGAKALRDDGRKVDEQVITFRPSDEPIPSRIVEPFDSPLGPSHYLNMVPS